MSRSRNYSYTLNNYTPDDLEELKVIDCTYHIIGKEGEVSTPHIQGTIRFNTLKSFKQVKDLIPKAHIEITKCMDASIQYCKKEKNFIEIGLYKNGRPTKKELIKRLREAPLDELVDSGELSMYSVASIKKARIILASEHSLYTPSGLRGIWYWGAPGTGKSRKARSEYPEAYLKAQNKWWDGYKGEKAIILDDLDSNVFGHYLKIWADRYSCTGEVKGGTVNLQHDFFVVTSNYHPDMLWSEDIQMCEAIKRRFKITHFNKPL